MTRPVLYKPNSQRERTASFQRYRRPVPGRRFRGQSHKPFRTPLRFSFRTRTPRSDTKAAPQNKYRAQCKTITCIKRGLSFPLALPTQGAFFLTCPQARAYASSLYARHPWSIQFMPPNSLSAPSAERGATRMRRCKASRGATVNCCNHRSSNRRSRH